MAARKLLALAALAGLALMPMEARADSSPKPAVQTVDTTKEGRKITRNSLSFDASYSMTDLNSKRYETGFSLGTKGSVNYQALKWLNLKADLDFRYSSSEFMYDNITEANAGLNLSLEGRVKLYSNRNLRLMLGLGADYMMGDNRLVNQGYDGRETRNNAGPMLSLGIESRYADLYINGSLLFGSTSSTYDRGRQTFMQHARITLVPRYWRVDMPISADLYHLANTGRIVDRNNFRTVISMQPGIKASQNLKIFFNFSYTNFNGDDVCSIYEMGIGGRLEW